MKKKIMKKTQKIFALLLAFCLAAGTVMPVMAGNGPNTGEYSMAWILLHRPGEDGNTVTDMIWSQDEEEDIQTVEGISYELSSNTLTLNNVNLQNACLITNEMGDDFKVNLVGDNHLDAVIIWGDGYGGTLELTGNGSLTLNEELNEGSPVILYAESASAAFIVDSSVTLNIYKKNSDTPAIVVNDTRLAENAIVFKGKTQGDLGIDSGEVQLEKQMLERHGGDVVTFDIYTKDGDDGIYALQQWWYVDEENGNREEPSNWSVYELIPCDKVETGYIAAEVIGQIEGDAVPEGYTSTGSQQQALEVYAGGSSAIVKETATGKEYVVVWEHSFEENKSYYELYEPVVELPEKTSDGANYWYSIPTGVTFDTYEILPEGYEYCLEGGSGLYKHTATGGSSLVLTQTPGEAASVTIPYLDVAENDWYYNAVCYNYQIKTMTGLDATHFGANETLARAQFAVILHRMNDAPKVAYKATFPDVPDGNWFTDAVLWAADTKVVTGYSDTGKFGPADKINREQMAVMMYRYANYKKYDTSQKADFSKFMDAAKVSTFAEEAMQWAVGNGIITGKDNGTRLDPQGNATRAECAAIIMRFIEKYGMGK
jgi:hypothetical protein